MRKNEPVPETRGMHVQEDNSLTRTDSSGAPVEPNESEDESEDPNDINSESDEEKIAIPKFCPGNDCSHLIPKDIPAQLQTVLIGYASAL